MKTFTSDFYRPPQPEGGKTLWVRRSGWYDRRDRHTERYNEFRIENNVYGGDGTTEKTRRGRRTMKRQRSKYRDLSIHKQNTVNVRRNQYHKHKNSSEGERSMQGRILGINRTT